MTRRLQQCLYSRVTLRTFFSRRSFPNDGKGICLSPSIYLNGGVAVTISGLVHWLSLSLAVSGPPLQFFERATHLMFESNTSRISTQLRIHIHAYVSLLKSFHRVLQIVLDHHIMAFVSLVRVQQSAKNVRRRLAVSGIANRVRAR